MCCRGERAEESEHVAEISIGQRARPRNARLEAGHRRPLTPVADGGDDEFVRGSMLENGIRKLGGRSTMPSDTVTPGAILVEKGCPASGVAMRRNRSRDSRRRLSRGRRL